MDPAFRVRDAREFEPHLHAGKSAEDREVIRIAEMADAEDIAGKLAQPGSERHVEALKDDRAHAIGVAAFGHAHRSHRWRIARRLAALQFEAPDRNRPAARFAQPRMAGEYRVQALLVQHRDSFIETVKQRGRGRVREKAAFVIGKHVRPIPITAGKAGRLRSFERLCARCCEGKAGRKHQAFLRTAYCHVHLPLIVAVVD